MTNLGFRLAMASAGIRVVDTRWATATCSRRSRRGELDLGGEQSGHVIFRDLATTGDGLLTAVQALDVVAGPGRPLAELAAGHDPPAPGAAQRAVPTRRHPSWPSAWPASRGTSSRLGRRGRVLVRPSGTEPLVRVMVEAPTERAGRGGRVAPLVATRRCAALGGSSAAAAARGGCRRLSAAA
jgi:phosphoglucosamine mutase